MIPLAAKLRLRLAEPADVHALATLIEVSVRALAAADYGAPKIETALGGAWGVDTELIRDGTYDVVEDAATVAACGGWSFRRTLFRRGRAAGAGAGSPRVPMAKALS